MPILGVTGGVATGKSSFVRALRTAMDAELFDADACARELLTDDAAVRIQVRGHFGIQICPEEGPVDRRTLRTRVFRNQSDRLALENILHPRIRERWQSMAADVRSEGRRLIVDIPLLYETHAQQSFDRVIVVACSAPVQRERLLRIRMLDEASAAGMVAAQLDLFWKIEQSHHVVWNEFSLANLSRQAGLLAACLIQEYG